MRWQSRRRSENIEDRRRIGRKTLTVGGGLGSLIVVALFLLLGGSPDEVLQSLQPDRAFSPSVNERSVSTKDREMADFVSVVLADTEDLWTGIFAKSGQQYREPRLVLFTEQISSACGFASAATGPFYCPGDEKVYLDLGFFAEMQLKLGAPGDFAMAYVIAHEVGHHVQNQLGILGQVMGRRGQVSEREFNQLLVRMELQADFLAGIWAHHARKLRGYLEPGDIEEGINAAGAVGDDRIQRRTQGYIVPDAFTHGTSEQRIRWFKKGLESGDLGQGDTFAAAML